MDLEARHHHQSTPLHIDHSPDRLSGIAKDSDEGGREERRTGLKNLTVRQVDPSDDELLWAAPFEASEPDDDVPGHLESGTGAGHLAEFQLALVSVSRKHPAAAEWIDAAYMARAQKAWTALAASVSPGQRLRILHIGTGAQAGAQPYRLLISGQGFARRADEACRVARELYAELQSVLELIAPELGWRELEAATDIHPCQWPVVAVLQPAALSVRSGASASDRCATGVRQPSFRLPLPVTAAPHALSTGVEALSRCPGATAVQIDLMPTRLPSASLGVLQASASNLLDLPLNRICESGAVGTDQPVTPHTVQAVESALRCWSHDPVGLRMRVLVRAKDTAMPASSVLRMLGEELWQGRPFAVIAVDGQRRETRCEPLDLSGLLMPSLPWPPVLPDASLLRAQGIPHHHVHRMPGMPTVGTILGHVPGASSDTPVRLHESAWSRHCHILGGTGTGKSKLVQSMVRDRLWQPRSRLRRPHAVIVLDPHGPLVEAAHADCPAWRYEHVVSLDFGEFDHAPSLNLLECSGKHADMERTFLIHALCETFLQMYPENKEAFGPMFFAYLTNAARLVMSDSLIKATLLDIPRVFSEPLFRRALIERCPEAEVRAFWRGIALRAGGEASLENVAPYIVSKFIDLQQPPIRAFLGQAESTIDFRGIMDRGEVALINLAKGKLGERQSRFLGLMLTSRILAALLSRADTPSPDRPEVHLVVDEFGSMMTPAFEGLLSEGRKYGLRAVLAHQHMAQVPPALAQSVLANAGGMRALFRLGAEDAQSMSRWVAPEFDAQALMTLPDRHAVVRMQVPNGITSPFLMRTVECADLTVGGEAQKRYEALRASSRARYCKPTADVDREIARRRAESTPVPELVKEAAAKVLNPTAASAASPPKQAVADTDSPVGARTA